MVAPVRFVAPALPTALFCSPRISMATYPVYQVRRTCEIAAVIGQPRGKDKRSITMKVSGVSALFLSAGVAQAQTATCANLAGGTGCNPVVSGVTSGSYDTAMGTGALNPTSTGINNTATGAGALAYNLTGAYNTASGARAPEQQDRQRQYRIGIQRAGIEHCGYEQYGGWCRCSIRKHGWQLRHGRRISGPEKQPVRAGQHRFWTPCRSKYSSRSAQHRDLQLGHR